MNLDSVIELMRKYGYSSTSVHPFVYKKGDTFGICYSYVDENYGILERVKFFDSLEIMDAFLNKITWVKQNGKANNVRMILDNYETVDPKVIFLRNEKIMVKGEMEDIEGFEQRAAAQAKMDEVSKVILQAGNLLLVYDDLKNRQIDYYSSVIKLRNEVRQKYYDLQNLIDEYNGVTKTKEVKLIPDISDTSGINIMMESSAKDRYNQFKQNHPTMDEAKQFVRDVWDLNANLESNVSFYEKQAEENSIRNEERVVDAKLEYMKGLQSKGKTLFKEDLGKAFRKINTDCKLNSVELSNNFIQEKIANATKKYSYFDEIDFFKISDYLKESIQNTNYGDLAIKYAKKDPSKVVEEKPVVKLPLNEIASNLLVEYNEKLNDSEQAILTLYNSKYRKLFDMILGIKDFHNKPVSDIIKILNDSKDFSKIKTECFDIIQKRLVLPLNTNIKNKYFKNIRFDSFEVFIQSVVNELKRMKAINNKMVLNSDLNLYFFIENIDLIGSKYFLRLTNDINAVISQIADSNDLIALTLLKQDVPVLYSPYTIDFGDLYDKDNLEFKVNGIKTFELLVDVDDVLVNVDDNLTKVVKYSSRPRTIGNISIVDEVLMNGQNVFCKLALVNNLANKVEKVEFEENGINVVAPVQQPVQPVVEPVQLVVQPVQPVVEPIKPIVTPVQPVIESSVENNDVIETPVTEVATVEAPAPVNDLALGLQKQVEVVSQDNVVVQEENTDTMINEDNKQNVDKLASMLETKVQIEDAKSGEAPVADLALGLQKQVEDVSSENNNAKPEDDLQFLDDIMGDSKTDNNNDSVVNPETIKEEIKEETNNEKVETDSSSTDDDLQFLEDLMS